MKIALIGPEATGKTELAAALAHRFGAVATEEYARRYFTERNLPADHVLSVAEMRAVMQGQQAAEREHPGPVFIDASTIHGALYAGMAHRQGKLAFDYAQVDEAVFAYATGGEYTGILLCMPHPALPWVDDGMRAMPDLDSRRAFALACEDFVSRYYPRVPRARIDRATWPEREAQAIEIITRWRNP